MNECSTLVKSRNEPDHDDVESKFRQRDRGDSRPSVVHATDDTDDNVSYFSSRFIHRSIHRPIDLLSGKKRRREYLVETAADSAEETTGDTAVLAVGCLEIALRVGNPGPEHQHCQRRDAGS